MPRYSKRELALIQSGLFRLVMDSAMNHIVAVERGLVNANGAAEMFKHHEAWDMLDDERKQRAIAAFDTMLTRRGLR